MPIFMLQIHATDRPKSSTAGGRLLVGGHLVGPQQVEEVHPDQSGLRVRTAKAEARQAADAMPPGQDRLFVGAQGRSLSVRRDPEDHRTQPTRAGPLHLLGRPFSGAGVRSPRRQGADPRAVLDVPGSTRGKTPPKPSRPPLEHLPRR